jgi:hypothetical protein
MSKPRYRCSKCSMGVIVLPNGSEAPHIIRACTCDAAISADMSATVVACGGVQQAKKKPVLTAIVTSVRGEKE